jgi:hypothetical protein
MRATHASLFAFTPSLERSRVRLLYYRAYHRFLPLTGICSVIDLVLLDFGTPWWQNDAKYCIGTLSKKTRRIQIVNVLTEQQDVLEVCSEETVNEILNRYLELNRYFCDKQPQFLMRKVHVFVFCLSFILLL